MHLTARVGPAVVEGISKDSELRRPDPISRGIPFPPLRSSPMQLGRCTVPKSRNRTSSFRIQSLPPTSTSVRWSDSRIAEASNPSAQLTMIAVFTRSSHMPGLVLHHDLARTEQHDASLDHLSGLGHGTLSTSPGGAVRAIWGRYVATGKSRHVAYTYEAPGGCQECQNGC